MRKCIPKWQDQSTIAVGECKKLKRESLRWFATSDWQNASGTISTIEKAWRRSACSAGCASCSTATCAAESRRIASCPIVTKLSQETSRSQNGFYRQTTQRLPVHQRSWLSHGVRFGLVARRGSRLRRIKAAEEKEGDEVQKTLEGKPPLIQINSCME